MKRLDTLRDNALATALMSRAAYYSMVKLREDSDLTPVRLVEHWAGQQQPDGLAITGPDGSYTYRALDGGANAVARSLQALGTEKGQRLVLMMASRPRVLGRHAGRAGCGHGAAAHALVGDALVHALRVIRPDAVLVGSECHAAWTALGEGGAGLPKKRLVWADVREPLELDRWAEDPAAAAARVGRLRAACARCLGQALSVSDGHDMRLPFVLLASGGPSELPRITLVTNQRFLQGCYYFGQAVLKSNPTDVTYNAGLPLAHRAAF